MAKFFREIRPYPGRWVGVSVGYEKGLVEWFKTIALKAWDVQTKTWWFPESMEPILSAKLVEHGLITREQAAKFSAEFYAHQKLGTAEEPYAILGIKAGSPRGFVDVAYQYWKRQYTNVGGAGTQLEEVEQAYRQIVGEP